jgi:hypothetical protein
MATEMQLPVVSGGGDRHCVKPNAVVNLTCAATFASRILFLPQYREAISCRYIEFISQAVRTDPEFAGRERWVGRVFRQTEDGDVPASTFWPNGGPWLIRAFVSTTGLIAQTPTESHFAPGVTRRERGGSVIAEPASPRIALTADPFHEVNGEARTCREWRRLRNGMKFHFFACGRVPDRASAANGRNARTGPQPACVSDRSRPSHGYARLLQPV